MLGKNSLPKRMLYRICLAPFLIPSLVSFSSSFFVFLVWAPVFSYFFCLLFLFPFGGSVFGFLCLAPFFCEKSIYGTSLQPFFDKAAQAR